MIRYYQDSKYHFRYAFDDANGAYVRTGVLDGQGRDTGVDPFMGSFPHLIDVGVMGHCIHGRTGLCARAGIGCYQNGLLVEQPDMAVEDFRWIAQQCRGRCNQLALGGRGDPDQHAHFEDLLRISRENDLAPNFTTFGYGMTAELAAICKKYCGAIAVSWYRSEYTLRSIQLLLDAGVRTNIHYVLGRNSIDEALARLERDDFPQNINAVIFLLHKPAGQGSHENVLTADDPRVAAIFEQIERRHRFKIGLDSCCVPATLNFYHAIRPEVLDACEGGRFSCYISADMHMSPCSFDQRGGYRVDLRGSSIAAAWNSEPFERFHQKLRSNCPRCAERSLFMGGCPLMPEVVLCNRPERMRTDATDEEG